MSTHQQVPRGFSLIEIIVSVGLFSVVMLVVTSTYLNIIILDKEARATNELTINLSFAVDSIARTVRTGTGYSCAGAGNGTCSRLSFTDSTGQTITYLLKTSDGTLGQCTGNGVCDTNTAFSLTDPRIAIASLIFNVRGVGTGDMIQPQTLVSLRGTLAASQGRTADFTLQTSATQRLLEL